MAECFFSMALIALVFCLVYILYLNGFAALHSKSALLYVGYPRLGKRRNCIEARFLSCNGVTKQGLRLRPVRQYRFSFSSHMDKGSVCVEIYGRDNDLVARLDDGQPEALIFTAERATYRVVTRFAKADGRFRLSWREA